MDRRNFLLAAMLSAFPSLASSQEELKPGQLLITGFRGTQPGDPEVEKVCQMLATKLCAGVILLRRNCTSREQVSRLSRAFRDASGGITPVISVDQEGGRVARLDGGNGFLDWMSAHDMMKSDMSEAEIEAYWTRRAWQLSEVGINLNFAPVVDLDLNSSNPIIGTLGRAFGSDPAQVTRMAEIFVRAHRSAGVKTTLKHFPGHGSSIADSHDEPVDISRSWQETELAPFATLTDAGLVDSIMTGHLLHTEFSDEPWIPASLSWRTVKAIRETLNFQGPIITDDMQMAAVGQLMPLDAAAIVAINAGATFQIFSNYRDTDHIDTVERVAHFLESNMDRMDPVSVLSQIRLAATFRSQLR